MSAIKRIVAMGLGLLMLCPAAMASGKYPSRVTEREDFVRNLITSGDIYYLTNAAVHMPVSGATLTSFEIKRGDFVEAGQVIGTYTVEVNPADIMRAKNEFEHAQADMDYELSMMEAQAQEYMELSESAASSDEARIYELKAEKCRLEAERYAIEAKENVARLEREYQQISASAQVQELKAPISGEVDEVIASGIKAGQGQLLMSMHDSKAALVRVMDFSGDLRYGMTVNLQLTRHSSGTATTGVVVACDSVLPASLRTGMAYIAYDTEEKGSTYSGATVNMEILRVEDAVVVSNQSVFMGDGGYYVQILDEDGTIRTRYVNKGFENNVDAWIISGVEARDKLIVK